MKRNIVVIFTVLTLPVAISACSSVSPAQKSDQVNQEAEALVKKCVVKKSSKDLKIKFVKTEKTRQYVLSPAQKENGISEQAVMELDYISSLKSKSWTDHTLRVLYQINQGKVELMFRDKAAEKEDRRKLMESLKGKGSTVRGYEITKSEGSLGRRGSSSCPESVNDF